MLVEAMTAPAGFSLQEQVPLAPLTTFGIGGPARYFATIQTEQELAAACAWAAGQKLPLFVLGGGSNLLVSDAGFAGLVLHMAIPGVSKEADGTAVTLTAGAGESWDGFVSYAVGAGYAGIECLAGIPGSVGATPVQNVGAYGQEVSGTIRSVRCFDRHTATSTTFSNAECGFSYRESRFNAGPDRGRYIVTAVRFALVASGKPTLEYADLRRVFSHATHAPSLSEVAAAVRRIRGEKGMVIEPGPLPARDPDCRSAGSFFKNPVISQEHSERLSAEHAPATIPGYPAPEGQRKLPAAWLVEQAGFPRGFAMGGAAISSRHTLALTNRSGTATATEVLALRDAIVAQVAQRFGITLQPEPVFLGE